MKKNLKKNKRNANQNYQQKNNDKKIQNKSTNDVFDEKYHQNEIKIFFLNKYTKFFEILTKIKKQTYRLKLFSK